MTFLLKQYWSGIFQFISDYFIFNSRHGRVLRDYYWSERGHHWGHLVQGQCSSYCPWLALSSHPLIRYRKVEGWCTAVTQAYFYSNGSCYFHLCVQSKYRCTVHARFISQKWNSPQQVCSFTIKIWEQKNLRIRCSTC